MKRKRQPGLHNTESKMIFVLVTTLMSHLSKFLFKKFLIFFIKERDKNLQKQQKQRRRNLFKMLLRSWRSLSNKVVRFLQSLILSTKPTTPPAILLLSGFSRTLTRRSVILMLKKLLVKDHLSQPKKERKIPRNLNQKKRRLSTILLSPYQAFECIINEKYFFLIFKKW